MPNRSAAALRAAASTAALLAIPLADSLRAQQPLALTGATVHAGDGSPPVADAVVLVRDGRVAAVGTRGTVPIPADARVVDWSGKHVTPGLIDTHVHYSQTGWVDGRPDASDQRPQFPYAAAMAANQAHPERFHLAFLHAGVTAVFDVGGYPWTRALGAAAEHDPRAPHVAATGALLATYDPKVLTLPDQQQFFFPTDEEQARAFVRHHKQAGSAAVKFWYVETPGHGVAHWSPILHAVGAEAHAQGLPLVVHATTLASAADAVDAGADLLVHSVENAPVDDAFVTAMLAKGTSYCPTLTVYDGYAQVYAAAPNDEVLTQLDAVHPSVKERVLRTRSLEPRNARTLAAMQKAQELRRKVMAGNLARLHAAGVPVVLGTDAGNPLTLHGPSIFVELEAMQAAGLPAKAVLVAATSAAARAMGRGQDLGVIAAGRVADLLALDADPERDARAFRSLTHVVRGGTLHERAALLPRGD